MHKTGHKNTGPVRLVRWFSVFLIKKVKKGKKGKEDRIIRSAFFHFLSPFFQRTALKIPYRDQFVLQKQVLFGCCCSIPYINTIETIFSYDSIIRNFTLISSS